MRLGDAGSSDTFVVLIVQQIAHENHERCENDIEEVPVKQKEWSTGTYSRLFDQELGPCSSLY